MKADITKLKSRLEGKQISSIELAQNADEGLLITFMDGMTLEFGYSDLWGYAKINDQKLNLQTF